MGEHVLPALTWLAVSVYGTFVILREVRPILVHHRLCRALGIPVPAFHTVGVWGAGIGGSLVWSALLGITTLRFLS